MRSVDGYCHASLAKTGGTALIVVLSVVTGANAWLYFLAKTDGTALGLVLSVVTESQGAFGTGDGDSPA